MALLSGKMNSVPQRPGKMPLPNSAPDWLAPNHLNLPAGVLVGPGLGAAVVVGPLLPGWHWWYHSLTT